MLVSDILLEANGVDINSARVERVPESLRFHRTNSTTIKRLGEKEMILGK